VIWCSGKPVDKILPFTGQIVAQLLLVTIYFSSLPGGI
jgi:hypothetical protein